MNDSGVELRRLTMAFVSIDQRKFGCTSARGRFAEEFARLFCKWKGLARASVKVLNEPRPKVGEASYLYGEYKAKTVYIYNLTPKRKRPVKLGVFMDTLIHELLHHYDQAIYGIDAMHDNNFYQRVDKIKKWLLPKGIYNV